MLTRRRFCCAAAASAAVIARSRRAFAATYDLLIKGGRVIDPSLGSMRCAMSRLRRPHRRRRGQHAGDSADDMMTRAASSSCRG